MAVHSNDNSGSMHDRIEELFHLAADLPRARQEPFLAGACDGDTRLRDAVLKLLESEREVSANWDLPAARWLAADSNVRADLAAGDLLGPYQIVDVIGIGGMGTVFRAARADSQYQQTVAIKLIKRGMDTDQIVARFHNERQILADLQHPNIARLLDGGTTADGRPYLVMEYVEGKPLDVYAREHVLTLDDRLRLFESICSAVQYAHQHLVIHRDLKPANVLVTADGQPKLLDFGIAKVLAPDASETIDATVGVRLLTPGYASPEQVRGEAITTASDVYSLGVMLYELLTGHSPYRDPTGPLHVVMRAVCEEEPSRPSTAMRHGKELTSPEPVTRRKLRGDLDNIALMALRKDPQRRYPSAQQLADDLRRYREGLPVTARGDAFSYVALKFMERHKLGVAAAAMLMLTMVAGVITTSRAQARAERRFNQVRKLAHSVVFDYHDAIEPLPGSTPIRQKLVKDALEYLDSLAKEADDPSLTRELVDSYVKISNVQGNSNYSNLGDTQGALASAKKAVSIGEPLVVRDPRAENTESLALAYEAVAGILHQTSDLDGANRNYLQCLALVEQNIKNHPDNSEYAHDLSVVLRRLGDLYGAEGMANLGKSAEAAAYYRRAVATIEKLASKDPGHHGRDLFDSYVALSTAERIAGHPAASEAALMKAIAIIRAEAASNPNNAQDQMEVAGTLIRMVREFIDDDRPRDAQPYAKEAAQIMEHLSAADPKNTLLRRNLAVTYTHVTNTLRLSGDTAAALEYAHKSLAISEALSASDPSSAEMRSDVSAGERKVAEALCDAGRLPESLSHIEKSITILRQMIGSSKDASLGLSLGRALMVEGDVKAKMKSVDARRSYEEAAKVEQAVVDQDPSQMPYLVDLASTLSMLGRYDETVHNCRAARDEFGRALTYWSNLEKRSALTAGNLRKAAEAKSAMQRCGS